MANTKKKAGEPAEQPKKGYKMDDTSENLCPIPDVENPKYEGTGKLRGKTAIVTGASSGIGAAAAIAFAKEGANVAVVYYSNTENANSVVARAKQLGVGAMALKGDVGSEKFAHRAVDKVVARFGSIDILVNNAGEQHPQESILDITSQQLERTFRTNIFSMFYFIQAALPHMNKKGCIINTSSLTAYKGSGGLLDYSATKGAIVSLTRSLSQNNEILGKKIRVNGVAPGPVWTPLIPASFEEGHVKKFGKDAPMKRPAQPYELAPTYVYLASDDASYVTGQMLHVNGGFIVNG